MNWARRVATLFGIASPAVTLSGAADALATTTESASNQLSTAQRQLIFSNPLETRQLLQLAAHASHSSHRSHSSHVSGSGGYHSSHYSGSGGVTPYVSPPPAPAPRLYSPPLTPPAPAPRLYSPSTSPPQTKPSSPDTSTVPRLTQSSIKEFIQRVQIALIVRGFDPGPVDGTLGEATKNALKTFQIQQGLSATGYLDKTTVERLGVALP